MIALVTLASAAVAMPTPDQLGRALAVSQACYDEDGYTNCNVPQPVSATFRRSLCVEYGSLADGSPIARCTFTGAVVTMRDGRRSFKRVDGDGAIDLIRQPESGRRGYTWLPQTGTFKD